MKKRWMRGTWEWEAHYDHCDIILLQMLYSANIIEVF